MINRFRILLLITFVLFSIGGFQLNAMVFLSVVLSPLYLIHFRRYLHVPRIPKYTFDWIRHLTIKDLALAGAIFVMHLFAIIIVGEISNVRYILPITVPLHYAFLGIMRVKEDSIEAKQKAAGY